MTSRQPVEMPLKPADGQPLESVQAMFGWNVLYAPKFATIVFLRWLFEGINMYGFHWSPSETETEIIISDKNTSYNLSVHKKPRIIVDRGPAKWEHISIDRTVGWNGSSGSIAVPIADAEGRFLGFSTDPTMGGRGGHTFSTNRIGSSKVITDLLSGGITVTCYAEDGLTAERLASLVFVAFFAHRELMQGLGFKDFNPTVAGRESPVFATSNYRLIGVSVTVAWSMMVTVSMEEILAPESQQLCKFDRLRAGIWVRPQVGPCYPE